MTVIVSGEATSPGPLGAKCTCPVHHQVNKNEEIVIKHGKVIMEIHQTKIFLSGNCQSFLSMNKDGIRKIN